ncbi:ribonuclease D [Nocardioides marmoribigeumensis]|uniref:Ribonuclease D n=1 Tax=Nocardioides marmoribigeumensis TaxID=433649 RepID=A0ABU2C1U6_9ACTN|nr:HRDC domain-containing protein [Nocardioides marmoribigeumensis]MDR7364637.1 ribonuclease D [Nocardioides marmoribigeumensis]
MTSSEDQPTVEGDEAPPPAPAPLLELRDGLPPVTADDAGLAGVAARLGAGTGPIAIDAERASGYRYSARAYLVQLRREGSGTSLVDPIDLSDVRPLAEALSGPEWILHAATQDLPCLRELGLAPTSLFDTELAGRLLGYPRVGLATLVEEITGFRLRKEHSAVDWSTRPLPTPWLEYAALDVEVLVELRDALDDQLEAAGKSGWARQEFEHLCSFEAPGPKAEPWRRTSGLHRVRGRRSLAAVRALWHARDDIAAERDVTPGRILPDSALVEAASALPRERNALLALPGFKGRGAARYAATWVEALKEARELPEDELPLATARYDGPPPPRAWADRDPVAAARLAQARAAVQELAASLDLPVENLLTPDYLRRVLWQPPADGAAAELARLGARAWQVELAAPLLDEAIAAHPPA